MINKNTKNKSFISAWRYLQDKGVENNSFMLELKNEKLADFSYEEFMNTERSKQQSTELREMIIEEIKQNIWFFFREIVRIPCDLNGWKEGSFDSSLIKGNSIPFALTDRTLSLIYLYSQGADILMNTQTENEQDKTVFSMLMLYEMITNIGELRISATSKEADNVYELYQYIHKIIPFMQTKDDFIKHININSPMHFTNEPGVKHIFYEESILNKSDEIIFNIITKIIRIHNNKKHQLVTKLRYHVNDDYYSVIRSYIFKVFTETTMQYISSPYTSIYDSEIDMSKIYRTLN